MTGFSEKMLVSTKYIHGFMSNLIKKSWTDSTFHFKNDKITGESMRTSQSKQAEIFVLQSDVDITHGIQQSRHLEKMFNFYIFTDLLTLEEIHIKYFH